MWSGGRFVGVYDEATVHGQEDRRNQGGGGYKEFRLRGKHMAKHHRRSRILKYARAAHLFVLVVGILLAQACKPKSDSDKISPLSVMFISPVNGEGSVPRQPVIYIRFDRPLDPATVIPTNFVLLDSLSAIIPATVTYPDCLNEVRVIPNSSLVAGENYQVSLFTGIADTAGITYVGSFFQFTVTNAADTDRPTFSGASSAGNPSQTSADITWIAAIDPSASGIVYDIFASTTSGCYDFKLPFLGGQSSPTGITVGGLNPATTYYFVVRARDAFGNVDLNEWEQSTTTLP